MNEEIPCVTNEVKMAKNEWENDDSDFLPALYILYKKSGQIFFHTLLAQDASVVLQVINIWTS